MQGFRVLQIVFSSSDVNYQTQLARGVEVSDWSVLHVLHLLILLELSPTLQLLRAGNTLGAI